MFGHGDLVHGQSQSEHINPLINYHNYGKSPFSMGKSTINGNFQELCYIVYQGVGIILDGNWSQT